MASFFKKRKGFFLPQLIAMLLMLSVIGVASVTQLSTFLSGVEAGGDGLQAKQYAAIKAESIGTFDTAVDEARMIYPDSVFETEVTIGPEIDLGGGKKQKIATINVYKVGDADPSFRLLKPLSSQGSGDSVPVGTILPWYGNISAIPSGYAYCDGTNGTPDLRGRTVIGTGYYGDSYGSVTYALGEIGGERLHKLTIAEMPSHTHRTKLGNGSADQSAGSNAPWMRSYGYTDPEGGDQPHNTMMPYRAVHWIMKI